MILAHCDDEIFLHPVLREWQARGQKVTAVYLVDQSANREGESRAELARFGVQEIFFLGRTTGATDGLLDQKLKETFTALKSIPVIQEGEIWTHDWEAGHPDHDACFLLASALGPINLCTFSAYNSWKLRSPLFRVMQAPPGPHKEPFVIRFSLAGGLASLRSLVRYRSQRRTFLGLGPFLVYHWIIRRQVRYFRNRGPYALKAGHQGRTLRESRFGRSFLDSRELYREFLAWHGRDQWTEC